MIGGRWDTHFSLEGGNTLKYGSEIHKFYYRRTREKIQEGNNNNKCS
jgi:hypothetical protein